MRRAMVSPPRSLTPTVPGDVTALMAGWPGKPYRGWFIGSRRQATAAGVAAHASTEQHLVWSAVPDLPGFVYLSGDQAAAAMRRCQP